MIAPTVSHSPITLRAASLDDVEAATRLLNLCAVDQTGAPEFTAQDLMMEWQSPGFNPARDIRLVEGPDGQLIGYIEVWTTPEPPVTPWVWGRVHPDFEGQGIGSALMDWAEERARQAIPEVPEGARVAMQSGTLSNHAPSIALFEDRGMKLIRHFWRMTMDLEQAPPAPQPLEGIAIVSFEQHADALAVYRAFDEAFKDHWGHLDQPEEQGFERFKHFTLQAPDFDPSLWFIALQDEQIAGVVLCSPRVTEDPEMGWVNILAVRRPWRRTGLGSALLLHAMGEFHRRGQQRVGLGVDASSLTSATRLYEKVGMHVSRQWSRYELELRPGYELGVHGDAL